MMHRVDTVSETVRRWAEREPDRVCLTFHGDQGAPERLTYGDLARRASAYARLYRAHGLRPHEAVILVAHTTPGFVAALLGAQDAGLVAVPCPPPEPLESARRVSQRVAEILGRCRARALVDPAPGAGQASMAAAATAAGATVLGTPAGDHDRVEPATADGRFAYCQFTSGSGGRAKGVLLTHGNMAANIRAMAEAYDLPRESVSAAWLPLFHDMGLVAFVLMPLVLGMPGHLIAPAAFLARPASWLRLISRVRATFSTAPNFAYAVCARKVTDDDIAALDLSSWRIAGNGAEPVTRSALAAFAQRFAACGFRASALLPCYGLAENTLCVSTRRPGEGPRWEEVAREALEAEGVARPEPGGACIVSVGRPIPGQEVRIRDGVGAPVPERHVGEIAVRGDSVMHSYLPGTEGAVTVDGEGWLLTGDLGYLAEGELFVVGRKKDLIIRGGRNYYPQDLEEAAATVSAVRPGRAAAFAVPGEDEEAVVLLVECQRDWAGDRAALQAAVRDAVFAAMRFAPDRIEILPANSLPLTSSGKIIRPEARRLLLEGRWGSAP